jgi:hypothetical protein
MKVKELREKLQYYDEEDEVRFESLHYSNDMSQSDLWNRRSEIEKFELSGGLVIYD